MANRGEKLEAVAEFIVLGSKITADGDCSHKIKRHLLFGRKALTNLDSVLKSRGTIYSLDILLFLFGTSLLFHVQF